MKMIPNNNCKLVLLIFLGLFIKFSHNQEFEDDIEVLQYEIEMRTLELMDRSDDVAAAYKLAILHQNYKEKTNAENAFAKTLREHANELKNIAEVPRELERNLTILTKPGDGLLPEDDYNALVSFHNTNEELKSSIKIPCVDLVDGCSFTIEEYEYVLENSRDVEELNKTWSRWQREFSSTKDQFPKILQLVNIAAPLNDHASAETYWEYLFEYDGAYSKADSMWEEIKPLYQKLHRFVNTRLANYYNLTQNDTNIPVYLLGNNFGNDWSNLAEFVLPHPQLHFDAENYLSDKEMEHVYELAEIMTQQLALGKFGNQFWKKSMFNMTSCEPKVLSFCNDKYTEVYTCNKTSWSNYLDAHETAVKVALINSNYDSIISETLRFSIIEDVLESLASILAVENLPYYNMTDKNIFKTEQGNHPDKMTKLLLVALRILPRLPYYLVADKWRLQEIQNGFENVNVNWWNLRKEYQEVVGNTNEEYDFLGDSFITSNKPYIPKFLGTILAFQLINQYRLKMLDPTENVALEFGNDPNFKELIKERLAGDWFYLFTINYGIDEILTNDILEYFKPLEEYLDNAPIEQAEVVTRTTTTTTTTTTQKPAPVNDTAFKREKKVDPLLSDAPNKISQLNATEEVDARIEKAENNIYTYAGVGLLCAVAVVLTVVFVQQQRKRRRRRPNNNRRFES